MHSCYVAPKPAHIDTTAPRVIRAEDQHGPLNARDQGAIDAGCNCDRRMSYMDWSHANTCPLHFEPAPASIATSQGDGEPCIDCCEPGSTKETIEEQKIPYGQTGVVLTAYVPVFTCTKCGMQWTDWRGEGIREKVVAAYLAQPKPAPQAEAQESAEEYVSVYETLGAKLDEKDAEIARLISRALTAEGKLAELTRNRETSYKHLVSSHVFPSRPGGYEEFYKREEVDPFMNAQQAKIDALEQQTQMLRAAISTPEVYAGVISEETEKHFAEMLLSRNAKVSELEQKILLIQASAAQNYAGAENRTHAVEEELGVTKRALEEAVKDLNKSMGISSVYVDGYLQWSREEKLREVGK